MNPTEPATLWTPSGERIAASRMQAYVTWLAEARDLKFSSYSDLWRWSVTELEAFWQSIADYFGVRWHKPASQVLASRDMPGAEWFPGAEVNWAEHALRAEAESVAIIYRSESGERREWTYGELRDQVARARTGLLRLGVARGDRVAGYLGNTPEAVASLLACASIGAIWSSCPPEFGASAVLDRFRQIEPSVLLAHDGYPYNGRFFDRSREAEEIRSGLPTLENTILLQRGAGLTGDSLSWETLVSEAGPFEFDPVPFEHPLWILYSSGTTGLPKALVHGHGGILLEHFKQLGLHSDLGPHDRFFWYSTTGWMMWNYLVSGLLLGSTIVLYEGSPAHPDLGALFRMAEQERLTYFGTSAPFLAACRKAATVPGQEFDLDALRTVGSTGAPLPPEGFEWVYESLKPDVALASVSGGTDVCTAFVGSCPTLPVRSGEIQCKGLGVAAYAFGENGEPVLDKVGELVITEPMPSMPVFFWNDPGGRRYRASYFEEFPGVWRHGDWIRFDDQGHSVIFGRSDSTLNRGGIRMGTSDFYRVVDTLPEIVDSLVIETGSPLSKPANQKGRLWLFVVLAENRDLDENLVARLRSALREALSPRHVPDEIRRIPGVPITLSGKKLEVPIRKILAGMPEEKALKRGTLANPEALAALLAAATDDPTG